MVEETSAYSQYHGIIQVLQRTAKAKGLELVVDTELRKQSARMHSVSRTVMSNYLAALERENDPKYDQEQESVRRNLNNTWTSVAYMVEGTTNGEICVYFDDQIAVEETRELDDIASLIVDYMPPGKDTAESIPEETPGFEIFSDGRIETEYSILKPMTYTQAFEYLLMLATQ
ncbi:MAG: hypothetical protein EPN86_02335 [Nanoarchaeota archaeon]|nr:MAG: hypothetical protein EPN86_02335 [Nanoarchaeota archaeon]